jgi:hypothetical protein
LLIFRLLTGVSWSWAMHFVTLENVSTELKAAQ